MTRLAVIGMAGRLPGATDLAEFWDNLLAGRDGVTRMSHAELRGVVPDTLLDDPRWVPASGRIAGVYDFDAAFYGMSPKEALTTDPQHRLLLATVRAALEDACVVPGSGEARIGIFGGVGRNRHEETVRAVLAARGEDVDEQALEIGHDKDHSTTKIAYRLGLRGPALTVQTACSTGLTALNQAGLSLTAYECDVAVVAAAAVRVPDQYGYLALPGAIGAPDGYCRPFSARAAGAVPGDGTVALVLKRLDDALADGDPVYATISGSAANNDGAKSGYAMVSAAAQEQVIRDALLYAEVSAKEIGAVEAHGSGTPLGDAVEWAALSAVYGEADRTLVGSVKSGIGHVREASGLAGLVRMVMSVRDGRIPPTLHVGLPAEFVARGDTGLHLARTAQPWPAAGPRRGAVSSFGLGGTNVHVVVEQAPEPVRPAEPESGVPRIVLLSGPSADAADRTARSWRDAVSAGRASLGEAADVSQLARRHRRHRRFVVARDEGEFAEALGDDAGPAEAPLGETEVCFVFPGMGDHYHGMGAGLYGVLPGFGPRLDRYLEICGDHAGRDLRGALYTGSGTGGMPSGAAFDLRRLVDGRTAESSMEADPVAAHASLFSVQLALAKSLRDLGVHPAATTGHSLGELAAAAMANVFTEEDALRVVVERAALVAAQPAGAMLAVGLAREQAEQLTGPSVWLAAVNSPRNCVLAGTVEAIAEVAERVERQGLRGRLMPSRHAFHTPLLDDAGARLTALLADLPLARPDVPMIANLTGDWAGDDLADPSYWHRQLTSPVLFSDALHTAASRCRILLEIGPGQLRTLVAQTRASLGGCAVVATVRREYQNDSDDAVLLRALGALWQGGVEPDWPALRPGAAPRRAWLPPTAGDERRLYVGDGVTAIVPAIPTVHFVAPPVAVAESADPAPAADLIGLESVLASLWDQILGTAGLRSSDDFFELGGDSMMSVRLIAGIERSLGVHIPAIAVFEESTLGGMARRIRAWQDRTEGERGE